MRERNNAWVAFVVAMGCSFFFAITFAVLISIFHPDIGNWADPWHSPPQTPPIFQPGYFWLMIYTAIFSGFLAWPIVYVLIRQRKLKKCLPWLVGITVGWIVIATPTSLAPFGWFCAYPVFTIVFIVLATSIPSTPLEGMCHQCGYNLTGNVSGRCPECGREIETGSLSELN